ncbi:MAG TPA: hypothetical protein VLA72_11740 [Anaerolineales bacterium]|nr:hypothetical protein [Anaerolineales bacterium]
MKLQVVYPTPEHEAAANIIVQYFKSKYELDAVLLVNSCARGKATKDSCLDIAVLGKPDVIANEAQMEVDYYEWEKTDKTVQAMHKVGKYSVVHPVFFDGLFAPDERDEAAGPDGFELGIGNFLAYSVPLWQGNDRLDSLRAEWLPYYKDDLRKQRLNMVREYCINNLHHIPLYVERGLYFQAFARLYNASQEFLQTLFITRRTYPIAYNKWIKEQVVEILGLPELYAHLVSLFEIQNFESDELASKAKQAEDLLDQYAPAIS